MLQLVVPALFQAADHLAFLGETRPAGLDMLLARGRHETIDSGGLESLLCRSFGIARQHDDPVAPISLAQSGGNPGDDYWLRADPVHVEITREGLILSEIPEPGEDEARMLCDALAAHFGEAFSPQPLRPGAWVVRAPAFSGLVTTPLSQAAGRAIDPLLPRGSDDRAWRKLLNEVQMLLFHHPVNQARETRGEATINSVWLWGGGMLPHPMAPRLLRVYCNHDDCRALALHAGAHVDAAPEHWHPQLPEDALVVLDAPHRHLRSGDMTGWLEAVRRFEHNWLVPLLAAGVRFCIEDSLQGERICWRASYRWKFWKRNRPAANPPFEMQIKPAADTGIDAFGNRYQ